MNKLTRRQFLKLGGATAGAIVIGCGCAPKMAPSTPTLTPVPPQTSVPDSARADRYIAYCGLDCAKLCPQYGSTTCPIGCLGNTCAPYCTKCPTRTCSLEHKVTNCALCKEYPCEKLESQYASLEKYDAAWAKSARAALEEIHRSQQ